MLIKQLSVFLENKEGRLSDIIDALAESKIDISALSLADTSDYGILRLIVDAPEQAQKALEKKGVIVRINHVLAVAMDDAPGGMSEILRILKTASISVEYMYACVGHISGKALTVMRLSDNQKGEEELEKAGFGKINPAEIYRI